MHTRILWYIILSMQILYALPEAAHTQSMHPQIEYHRLVNEAKQKMLEKDYSNAAHLFKSAFSQTEKIYFYDLKNYVISCRKSGFDEQRLIGKLFKYCDYDTTRLYAQIPKILFQTYDGIAYDFKDRSDNEEQINIEYKNQLNRMYLSSSVYIRDLLEKIQSESPLIKSEKLEKDYVDSLNLLHFKGLIKDYGFPHEDEVGFMINDSLNLYDMLINFLMNYKNDPLAMSYFDSLMMSEKVYPQLYANLFDSRKSNEDYSFSLEPYFIASTINISDKRIWKPFVYFSDSILKEVDNHRAVIGMDAFHVQQKQVLCGYLCAKADTTNQKFIQLNPLHSIPIVPYGMVKSSFDMDETLDYKDYIIDVEAAINECDCEALKY